MHIYSLEIEPEILCKQLLNNVHQVKFFRISEFILPVNITFDVYSQKIII